MLDFILFLRIQYVFSLFFFKFIKSFPSNFINKPIGVTTKKNIIPIIIGETKLPKKTPNLNHALFNGVRTFEFNIPKIKKINDIKIDQILNSFPLKIGQKPISKNTTKKTIPKLLFDPIFISLCFNLN